MPTSASTATPTRRSSACRRAAVFLIDGETHPAGPGHVVVVPGGTAHGFDVVGDEPFRSVNIHCNPTMEIEWLED